MIGCDHDCQSCPNQGMGCEDEAAIHEMNYKAAKMKEHGLSYGTDSYDSIKHLVESEKNPKD